MARRPDTDAEAEGLERGWDVIGESGLEVDEVADGMKTWPLHGVASAQAFVEDAADDLHERAAQAGSARRSRREG